MYADVGDIFARYWKIYGGTKALLRSPYLHTAILLVMLTSHDWLAGQWWQQPLSVIPNLLGFSLAGLAVFLSFGDERFRSILAEVDDQGKPSAYMEVCATFVHFIVLQLTTLLFALVSKSLDFAYDWPQPLNECISIGTSIFSCLGSLLFLYSITSMLAAAMAVFRVGTWYEFDQRHRPRN